MEIDVGVISVDLGECSHEGARNGGLLSVANGRHVHSPSKVAVDLPGAVSGAQHEHDRRSNGAGPGGSESKQFHFQDGGLETERFAQGKPRAWTSVVAHSAGGDSNGGLRKHGGDSGQEEVESTGGHDTEKEEVWEEGITWDILAAEFQSMRTAEESPNDDERIIRTMELDVAKALRKLGKFLKLAVVVQTLESMPSRDRVARNCPSKAPSAVAYGMDVGLEEVPVKAESERRASVGHAGNIPGHEDGFTEVRSRRGSRQREKGSQSSSSHAGCNQFQVLEGDDPDPVEDEGTWESVEVTRGEENCVRRAVTELRLEQRETLRQKRRNLKDDAKKSGGVGNDQTREGDIKGSESVSLIARNAPQEAVNRTEEEVRAVPVQVMERSIFTRACWTFDFGFLITVKRTLLL
ncbi:hypothetical protein R1sor_015416 [Riccia sorocarpa]|uniref:Uncharacterized protein n=1 Tax=Riccia sorocarpa TaxID=122646 RepID=A0ABD3HEW4_9MARC